MSIGSLHKLALLSGAKRIPSSLLYNGRWPSRARRLGQIARSTLASLLPADTRLVLHGEGLPACSGRIHLTDYASLRDILSGALVIRNASALKLTSELSLGRKPPSTAFLADNGVLVVISGDKEVPLVAHVTDDKDRCDRYRRNSELARRLFSHSHNEGLIPQVVGYRAHSMGHVLLQTRLPGTSLAVDSLDTESLVAHTRAALEVLPLSDAGYVSHPPLGADIASSVPSLLAHPEIGQHLRLVAPYYMAWLDSKPVPAIFAHGDFCYANVLYQGSQSSTTPAVTGVIDWEMARAGAPLGEDALYFVVMAFGKWSRRSPIAVLSMLWEHISDPTLGRLIALVTEHFGLSIKDVRYLSLHLWLRHLARQGSHYSSWPPERRHEWLLEPAHSVERWLKRRAT